jgi:alkanesulfonate monooxygenase SsuD/methylene tetrahydromethanopterin reductase-like flavin-dependent oxidoreductase (luciferase family)
LLGGRGTPRNLDRVVAWADGWIPAGIGVTNPELASALGDLRRRWDDAGRPGTPEICCFFAPGPPDDMAAQLERASELEIQRMHIRLEERPRDEVLPILDDLASVLDR